MTPMLSQHAPVSPKRKFVIRMRCKMLDVNQGDTISHIIVE